MVPSLFAAALVLAFPAAAAAATAAQGATAESGTLAAELDAIMESAETDGFGGALIVSQGDAVILTEGYGFADRESGLPFTPRTVAQIGSITKTFTALAISNLVAEGRIDLDQSVGEYLPRAAEPGRSLVLRDLLTHRSGLLDICGDDFERMTGEDVLTDCLSRPLAHPAGQSHYSNLGYTVLAMVVEAVTGEDWEAYLRRALWQPLGMHDTGFLFAGRDQSGFAKGYLDGRPDPVISERIAELRGADRNLRGNGGVQASPEDMMRFLRALVRGHPAIETEVRTLMLSPHTPVEDDVAEGFGLFFRFGEQGEIHRVGHAGSDGVFMSYIAWFPQSDILLYFVGNNGADPVREVLRAVLARAGSAPPAG